MRVVWDEGKRRENISKHGIDFREAHEMFDGPILVALDIREDYGEDRFIGLGSIKDRVVVIAYSEPEEDTVRVISLRKANKNEREKFAEELAQRLGPS